MATVNNINAKVSMKFLDRNNNAWSEELGYLATPDGADYAPYIANSDTLSAGFRTEINNLMNGIADLVNGTMTNKTVTYTMEVAND